METHEGASTVEAAEAPGMNTYERVSADEAAQALAAAESSRARVAWSGYPWWYWIGTGAGLGVATYTVGQPGHWWDLAIPGVTLVLVILIAYAASKARGVCEGWLGSALTRREVAVLYGPSIILMLASAEAAKHATWPPIAAAVTVFALFAGTGLAKGALAARAGRP
jgi:hypothetical protein